jgi:hypothetical protein
MSTIGFTVGVLERKNSLIIPTCDFGLYRTSQALQVPASYTISSCSAFTEGIYPSQSSWRLDVGFPHFDSSVENIPFSSEHSTGGDVNLLSRLSVRPLRGDASIVPLMLADGPSTLPHLARPKSFTTMSGTFGCGASVVVASSRLCFVGVTLDSLQRAVKWDGGLFALIILQFYLESLHRAIACIRAASFELCSLS